MFTGDELRVWESLWDTQNPEPVVSDPATKTEVMRHIHWLDRRWRSWMNFWSVFPVSAA